MKRALGVLAGLSLWVMVALSVAITLGSLLGRPVLLAAVPTGSMVPTLRPGDLIVVVPLGLVPRPQVGDIIVYRSRRDAVWVVHRVVDGDPETGYVTRGDANPLPDTDRVQVQDIIGFVPVWRGAAVRVPHLGFFSQDRGPLSSPLAAGAALLLGLYLLGADAGATLRALRAGRWRRLRLSFRRSRPETVLSVYAGLAGAALLSTLLATWSLASVQRMRYEVMPQAPSNVRAAGRVVAGQELQEEIVLTNPSLLPLLVTFHSTDDHLRYDPGWLVVPPRRTRMVRMTLRSPQPGSYEVTLRQGVYLPWLPTPVLRLLDRVSPSIARIVSSLAPAVLILLLAMGDQRMRRGVRRVTLRLRLRLGF